MKVHPEGDNILVREIDGLDQTDGGIWIPQGSGDHHYAAVYEVIEVGPGRYTEMGHLLPMPPYKPGDYVFMSNRVQGRGIIEIEGDRLGFVQPHEIAARVELDERERAMIEKAKARNVEKRKGGKRIIEVVGSAKQLGKVKRIS